MVFSSVLISEELQVKLYAIVLCLFNVDVEAQVNSYVCHFTANFSDMKFQTTFFLHLETDSIIVDLRKAAFFVPPNAC